MSKVRFLGLDVHADTIAVAIAEPKGEVRSIGVIPNRLESIRRMVNKLGPASLPVDDARTLIRHFSKQKPIYYATNKTLTVQIHHLTQLPPIRFSKTLRWA